MLSFYILKGKSGKNQEQKKQNTNNDGRREETTNRKQGDATTNYNEGHDRCTNQRCQDDVKTNDKKRRRQEDG